MQANANGPANRLDPSGSRHLRTLWTLGAVGGMSDADLLARFVAGSTTRADLDAAELAFGAIVDRHGGTVLRVARTILGDEAASLDASQATFLLLAQKARRLHVGESLGPWLGSVARRVALGARKARACRQRHEAAAARPELVTDPTSTGWSETIRAVVAEVERLPEPYRAAVVACHLDGLTQHAAADRLGWPVGTLQSRLDRGRRKLRDRLIRRGLAPSALGLLPTSGLNLSLPPTLAATLARTAPLWLIQAAPSTLIAPTVLALVSTTAKGTATMKLTAAALTLTAALGVLTTSVGPRLVPGDGVADPNPASTTTREVGDDRLLAYAATPTAAADDPVVAAPRASAPVQPGPAVGPVPTPPEADDERIPPFSVSPRLLYFSTADPEMPDEDRMVQRVTRLSQQNYPVGTIFTRNGEAQKLVDGYNIQESTVLIVDQAGQVLGRRTGEMTTRELAEFYHQTRSKPAPKLPTDESIPPPVVVPGMPQLICFPDPSGPTDVAPDLDGLRHAGYPVQVLDFATASSIARLYEITSTPAYVVANKHLRRSFSIVIRGKITTRNLAEQYNELQSNFAHNGPVPTPAPVVADPPSEPDTFFIPSAPSVVRAESPKIAESTPPPARTDDLTTLLCFPAEGLPNPGQVVPDLDKLADLGYPIRKVAADADPGLARRFRVTARPTYLVVNGSGQGVSKAGELSTRQLAEFYNENLNQSVPEPPSAAVAPAPKPDPATLLCFQAEWSSPCQEMTPRLNLLSKKGYPIQIIDIDKNRFMAQRYNVTAVPAFILVNGSGDQFARTEGAKAADDLAQFFNENRTLMNAKPARSEPIPAGEPSFAAPELIPRPWETVVRVKNHLSGKEWGFASGTVIASTPEAAYILTVDHAFRNKDGRKFAIGKPLPKLSVDLFDGKLRSKNPAQLTCITRDLSAELVAIDHAEKFALLRIRPGRVLPVTPLVAATWKAVKGMNLYTTGCSHGEDATAWNTQILDPRVKMNDNESGSFDTIKCQYQPAEGRSGGGLFTTEGYLVGICNFADPNEHVGLYRGPDFLASLAQSLFKGVNGTDLDLDRLQAHSPRTTLIPGRPVPAGQGTPQVAAPVPDPRLVNLERKLDRIIERLGQAPAAEPFLEAPAVVEPEIQGEVIVPGPPVVTGSADPQPGIDDGIVVPLSPEQVQGSGPAQPRLELGRVETRVGADGQERSVYLPVPQGEPAPGLIRSEPVPVPPVSDDHERRLRDLERKLDRVLESLDNIRGRLEPKPSPASQFDT